ncbi:hypothetical protein [Bacillus massiliigorillae]|uniref:hypothetical protein n=1 Tax=Bacillus massiliigorillae TaxID=1243664 RepID=UPI00039C8D57|nr:hypothetical protein [Bacillus massiliigorillae]
MRNYIRFILLFLVLILVGFISISQSENAVLVKKAFEVVMGNAHTFNKMFSIRDVQVKKGNIDIEVEKTIDKEYTTFEYFFVLNSISKDYRFTLQKVFQSQLDRTNISIHFQVNSDIFTFQSELPIKTVIDTAQCTFKKNDKVIYTTADFKREIEKLYAQSKVEKINGYDDFIIYQYQKRFFNILTKKGKDFHPEKDVELIRNATMVKFQITPQDVTNSYLKYEYSPLVP